MLSSNSPGPAGTGTAAFALQPNEFPFLVGLTFNHAFITLVPFTTIVTFASNAVPLKFLP